jgi:hypothetical protein
MHTKINTHQREHIRWKQTPPCKLWKLHSEPHDVDPREDSWEVGGVMCKTHERWERWFAKALLQITPPTSYEPSFGSTSCGSDWSFHSLHGWVCFHLICCPHQNGPIFLTHVLWSKTNLGMQHTPRTIMNLELCNYQEKQAYVKNKYFWQL